MVLGSLFLFCSKSSWEIKEFEKNITIRKKLYIFFMYLFLEGKYSFNFNQVSFNPQLILNMSIDKKEFDVIIWGASGFTGRLVAEYLFQNYNKDELNWAIAGRDIKKLNKIRDQYLDQNIPVIIADSFDEVSLLKMTERTKVICTTVGPYAKYGSQLDASQGKIKNTLLWFSWRSPVDKKNDWSLSRDCQENQIKIVNSCGFDSVPSDLGVYYIHKNISKKNLSIKMRVTGAKGHTVVEHMQVCRILSRRHIKIGKWEKV